MSGDEKTPEQLEYLRLLVETIRDAQVSCFTFAKSSPGETDWLRSLFRALSTLNRVIEVQMLNMTIKKGNTDGEN